MLDFAYAGVVEMGVSDAQQFFLLLAENRAALAPAHATRRDTYMVKTYPVLRYEPTSGALPSRVALLIDIPYSTWYR